MQYVYDVMVNFSKNSIIDFYEWEEQDNIMYIKKIPIFKITKSFMNDYLNNNIIIDNSFLNSIYKKTEIKKGNIEYAALFTDGRTIIAVNLSKTGEILLKSSLLLEDEINIMNVTNHLPETKISYKVISVNSQRFKPLTRKEKKINDFIIKELKNLYKIKDYDRIKYYYYEYFNQQIINLKIDYEKLLKAIESNFSDQNIKLYDVIQLTYQNNH